jgi:DNA-binding FadR family transcriptional regulator
MNSRKLHEQARRAIERLIADRGIKAGGPIPSESKLAGELYVSRTTIRRALRDLEEKGKIEHGPDGVTVVRQTHPKKVPKQPY